nr:hypothetical protein [Tanacetum cinerariifolium]
MVAILEKSEHNVDFHLIVDFIEASPLRYALTFKLTVYVSHIRQFWSTARIETRDKGTKILTTVDSILRTVSESSIRRNIKLKDEVGISSLPDAKLFENLTLMGYNISLNQKFTFQKDEPASPLRDVSQGKACPTVSSLEAEQDRANIGKTSTLPHESTSRVTSLAADEGIPTGSGSIPTAGPPATGVPTGSDVVPTDGLIFATATVLEEEMERDAQRMNEQIARDAEIARIHAEEELQMMINSLDRSNETVVKYLQEYEQIPKYLSIGKRIELISDLVKYQENYAQVLKYQTLQIKPRSKKQKKDYYMAIEDFIPMGSKEETERFKRKGLRLKQESAKKLKTSKEVPEEVKSSEEVPEEKVKEMMQLVHVEEIYVEALQVKHLIIDWKVYIEGQRSYWKITRLGGSSASYQFFVDMLKHLDREDLNQLWRLVKESLSIRLAISDKEMELWVELKRLYETDVEDQLWTHTQNLMHAPVEWKLYDTCRVHHVTSKDKEIFMLVEKDYPFRKGLAIVMICYKLQIDSLLDEFARELFLLKKIPPGIDETDCDFKEDIRLIEKLLYDNSSPRPPKEFVSANSDAVIKSFSPSPILVKDSDLLMEEIDLFCTPDYPMPPDIEDKDYDSERDILILKDLPSNNTLSFVEK